MKEFKKYQRTQIAEMRPVTQGDIKEFLKHGEIESLYRGKVSISDTDLRNDSPKIGDMIARNPKNHHDQWLVAKKYFTDNFAEID